MKYYISKNNSDKKNVHSKISKSRNLELIFKRYNIMINYKINIYFKVKSYFFE